jgi:hypothetical protein
MAFGQSVLRDRRKSKPDPYDPSHEIPGSWSDPVDTAEIKRSFVASSSSTAVPDASRTQFQVYKSLYCPPDSDVKPGDRIRADGVTYEVNGVPQADTNPFTGWRPTAEIPLKVVMG